MGKREEFQHGHRVDHGLFFGAYIKTHFDDLQAIEHQCRVCASTYDVVVAMP